MPFNGSGVYSPVPRPDFPAVALTTVRAAQYNNQVNDLAEALTKCVTRDGQSPASNNLPMATWRHTDVGAALARTQYLRAAEAQDGALLYLSSVAGADTITATAPLALSAYVKGQTFRFLPAAANTGNVTLNINSIGATPLLYRDGGQLLAGALQLGSPVEVFFDGTNFLLMTGFGSALGTFPGFASACGVGADVASAASLVLTNLNRVLRVTGTVTTTSFTLDKKGPYLLTAAAAWPIDVAGVLVYTCAAGDSVLVWEDNNGTKHAQVFGANGLPVNTVNLTGNQTVADIKTFSSAPVLSAGATFGSATLANVSTSAPLFGARAFGVFDGRTTGTFAPNNSGNVASITRTAAGTYTVNLSTALGSVDYCVVCAARNTSVATYAIFRAESNTTSSFVLETKQEGGGLVDCAYVTFAVFRT